jgi:hypothetical protein
MLVASRGSVRFRWCVETMNLLGQVSAFDGAEVLRVDGAGLFTDHLLTVVLGCLLELLVDV